MGPFQWPKEFEDVTTLLSDHFDGVRFFNPWGRFPEKGFLDMLKWQTSGQRAKWPVSVANEARPAIPEKSEALRVTFIGHATLLAQVSGINILIDPVFSERCSPFSSLGPKRVRRPFVDIKNLPKIDYVFVSHNHYDHMDRASLAALAQRHRPSFIAPLGNARHIGQWVGKCPVAELDWHEGIPLSEQVSLTLTPSQHWSRRRYSDINRDLWGGFFLKTAAGQSLYYCGDSGFHESVFAGIHQKYGAPDIALLPIGAYEPRWFMGYSHMNPDDAMKAFALLQAKRGMGFHFETFQLTDEAFDAPRKHTTEAMKKYGVAPERFLIPHPGDFIL